MAVKTKAQLQAEAAQIANETGKRANTAPRVGNCILDVADSMSDALDVTSYGATTANTGAANDPLIALAITAATAAGADLYWPAGTYQSAASIASLHAVRHRGPGAIQRGSDVFYLDPKYGQQNALYVSTTGTGGNDGLSASQSTTPDAAFAALYNYGPILSGVWTVQFAAGTYARTAQLTLEGLGSVDYLRIRGANVGGSPNAPTTILDGATSTGGVIGMYFRANMRVAVYDIQVKNFASTDAHGIIIDRFTEGVFTNVWTTGNNQAGIHADSACRLYIYGGTHSLNVNYNIRAYAGCIVSMGTTGVAGKVTVGNVTFGGGAGIHIRDHSSGHVDYTDITGVTGSGGGLEITNQSRVHLVSVVFSGCYYNIRCDEQSTYIEDTVTHGAASAHDVACWGFSIPTADQQNVYYDTTTGFFKFGRSDVLVPKCLVEVANPATAQWGGAFNSSVLLGITSAADSYFGLAGGNAGSCGIHFADVAGNRQGVIEYVHASDYMQMRVNAIDAFRWFSDSSANGYYRSEVTGANAASLGDATHPWSKVYSGAAGIFWTSGSGSPESAVTAPVGSLYSRTDGGATTSLYVKTSGTGNTGWTAK
jgi:hypothetical protein